MAVPVADQKLAQSEGAGSADEKAAVYNVEDPRPTRMQAPEWIRNLEPEERERLETRLKHKIDLRLLPAIIVMYIMNYIDRCVMICVGAVVLVKGGGMCAG